MVVDVLRQMRERLNADIQYEKNLTGENGPLEKVYAYQNPIPDDLWLKCPACEGVMFREDFEKQNSVCTFCGHHYRIDSRARLLQIVDPGSFVEWDAGMSSENPIQFAGYPEKIKALQKQTGLTEAVITGQAAICSHACCIGVMDARFMMGSMGSVVGEKLTRLFEQATSRRMPVIVFAASGGARMQEGIVSLMQMAKTSAAVARFQAAGLLYISVLTDPTTGGVTASFASLGDIILSEPGTLIGFAGRRVIEGTIAEALPAGFQRAEFLLEHGFLDLIVPRNKMRTTLADLLAYHDQDLPAAGTARDMLAVHMNMDEDTQTAGDALSVPPKPALSGSEKLDIIRIKNRPVLNDYMPLIFEDLVELHGDRQFRDDQAIWSGLARFSGLPVTVIGHRKGRTLEENARFNFGMPHPEGYRKALRLMKQAEKYGRPIICFIDTPGAYCGVAAEERGQGEAIARNLMEMIQLAVPVIAVVMGEGGSGGALAIGIGDELAMFSNALYSVISPRGFASLLWKDPSREREAADVIRITAEDLQELGVCDAIITEPRTGAQEDVRQMADAVSSYLKQALARQLAKSPEQMLQDRYDKYRKIGSFTETMSS